MPPKVSVIVPNYNHAAFLRQRINSILNQSYTDFELILLDDKSSDNSPQIIEQYKNDAHVKHVVLNEKNSGSSFIQWKLGMSLCQGEYIWIAESDDAANEELLATLVKTLDENQDVGLAYCQSYAMNEDGNITGSLLKTMELPDKEKWQHNFLMRGEEFVKHYMVFKNVIPNASAVLFRRSAKDKGGEPDGSYRLNGDWNFWINLALNSRVAYVADCLNYFRFHSKTVRSKAILEGLNYLEYTRIIQQVFNSVSFNSSEKRNVINYFHGQLGYTNPITPGNLVKSYFKLAPYDMGALLLFAKQLRWRYL